MNSTGFPVFHSYISTCTKYICVDDSIAITGFLMTDPWYLSSVEMQWGQLFFLAFTLNRHLCWRMDRLRVLWQIISNVHHFSEESISKPGWKVWVLFLQAGERMALSKSKCQHSNQNVHIITLFISDFFFSVNGQWLCWQHCKIHCVCMYLCKTHECISIFLTSIILKYFAYSITSIFTITSAMCYKDTSGKGK